jgi:hypothetical protein
MGRGIFNKINVTDFTCFGANELFDWEKAFEPFLRNHIEDFAFSR